MSASTFSFWQSLFWVLPGEIGVENQTVRGCRLQSQEEELEVRAVRVSLRLGRAGSSVPSRAALAPQHSDWLLPLSFRPLDILHTV